MKQEDLPDVIEIFNISSGVEIAEGGIKGPPESTPLESWEYIFGINTLVIYSLKQLSKDMHENPNPKEKIFFNTLYLEN